MIILGIDPGLARLGYGVVERNGNALRYETAGVVKTPSTLQTPERIKMLWDALEQICVTHCPNRIVLERLFPAPNRNLLGVNEVRGIVLLCAGQRKTALEEVSPTALKALTTRSGRATKLQVQKTIQRLLSTAALPPADAADALALAILGSSTAMR